MTPTRPPHLRTMSIAGPSGAAHSRLRVSADGFACEEGRRLSGMQAVTSLSRGAAAQCSDLQARLLDYASSVKELGTPDDVLDALHSVASKTLPLRVLGAARFPINDPSWKSLRSGKSVFLHK